MLEQYEQCHKNLPFLPWVFASPWRAQWFLHLKSWQCIPAQNSSGNGILRRGTGYKDPRKRMSKMLQIPSVPLETFSNMRHFRHTPDHARCTLTVPQNNNMHGNLQIMSTLQAPTFPILQRELNEEEKIDKQMSLTEWSLSFTRQRGVLKDGGLIFQGDPGILGLDLDKN